MCLHYLGKFEVSDWAVNAVIKYAFEWFVGIDYRLQYRATSDYESNYNERRHLHRAVGRARANPSIPSSSATNAHGIPFNIFRQLPRSTLNMPHSIYTKIVCIRLPVATAVWRAIIHCYWMLVLLIQHVGLVWNPLHIYMSVIRQ